jgi:hypothetical protein
MKVEWGLAKVAARAKNLVTFHFKPHFEKGAEDSSAPLFYNNKDDLL